MSENMVQFVTAACNGDTDAMAKLYSKTLKASYFLADLLCAGDGSASELTKKAYAKAFCSIEKLKKPEAFEIWMKQNVAAVYKEGVKFVFGDADAGAQELSSEFLPEDILEDADKGPDVHQFVQYRCKCFRYRSDLSDHPSYPSLGICRFMVGIGLCPTLSCILSDCFLLHKAFQEIHRNMLICFRLTVFINAVSLFFVPEIRSYYSSMTVFIFLITSRTFEYSFISPSF